MADSNAQHGMAGTETDWERQTLRRFEKLKHMGEFLWSRGLNTREMDDWNLRLMQLANLNSSSSPGWFERRTWSRVMDKFENAALKQLREKGLLDEWRRAWETDSES